MKDDLLLVQRDRLSKYREKVEWRESIREESTPDELFLYTCWDSNAVGIYTKAPDKDPNGNYMWVSKSDGGKFMIWFSKENKCWNLSVNDKFLYVI